MGWKAAEKLIKNWKIFKGDHVVINQGKDKGETGVIKHLCHSTNRVIVEGKNLVKRHVKPGQGREGGIFTREAPLHYSNVQLVDPVTGKPCRIGYKYLEDGTKVRYAMGKHASGTVIPRPKTQSKTRNYTFDGPKDTPMEFVKRKTYDALSGRGNPPL